MDYPFFMYYFYSNNTLRYFGTYTCFVLGTIILRATAVFPSCIMYGSMHLIWTGPNSRTCVQAIEHYQSLTVRACCPIPTLGWVSNLEGTVVDMACFCRVVSATRLIVPLFPATKTANMRRVCQRLCGELIRSRYPKLVCPLSSYVVRLVTFILSNDSIIGWVTVTLTSVCVIMRWKYLQADTTLSCLSSHCRIGQVITSRPLVGDESWKVSLALHSKEYGFCILLWLHFRTSSVSLFGLGRCDVRVGGMHYLSRSYGLLGLVPLLQFLVIVAYWA